MEKEFITFCESLGMVPWDYPTQSIGFCWGQHKPDWGCAYIPETNLYFCFGNPFKTFKEFKEYVIKLIEKEKKKLIKNKLKDINKDFI